MSEYHFDAHVEVFYNEGFTGVKINGRYMGYMFQYTEDYILATSIDKGSYLQYSAEDAINWFISLGKEL